MSNGSPRAASTAVSVLLLVAGAVVVLVALYSVSAIDFGPGADASAPTVSDASGNLTIDDTGSANPVVELTHVEGDTLEVEDVELVVTAQAACGKSGRLVNLPAPDGDPSPPADYVRGDDIFDNSDDAVTGPIGEDNVTVDGTWSTGETATFRLDGEACPLDTSKEIVVRIQHSPTTTVLAQLRLTPSAD